MKLNKKENIAEILSWFFGVPVGLIGLASLTTDTISGIMLLIMSLVLLPPVNKFTNKKWNFKLSRKIKTVILIVGFVGFVSFIEVDEQAQKTNNNVSNKNNLVNEVKNDIVEKEENSEQDNNIIENKESDYTNDNTENNNLDNLEIDNPKVEINSETKEEKTENIDTPQNQSYYSVVKVVDGDTVDVNINGKVERLRLIGMDTPETVDPRKPVECFGVEASNKAKELLTGKKVKLVSDNTQDDRDKYGRLLRYLYLEDGTFFNKWMIQNGYAHEYTYVIPYIYQTEFQQAENYARTNELGLWSPNICNEFEQTNNQTDEQQTTQEPTQTGHIFYTSGHYSAKQYYCDTDSAWEGLSEKYLETYNSEAELLAKYPNKTLHEPCK